MGHVPKNFLKSVDSEDFMILCGFACIVLGVAWRYDGALALIVFGVGLLLIGLAALWRRI